jgi:hypothetical protein
MQANKEQNKKFVELVPIVVLLEVYFSASKKLTKQRSSELYEHICATISESSNLISFDRFKRRGDRRLTSSFDAVAVASVMETLAMENGENGFRRFLLTFRVKRSAAEMRSTAEPMILREHALRRFHERTGAIFSFSALWPAVSLISAYERFQKPGVVKSFSLPVEGGAFLGLFVGTPSKQSVERCSISVTGTSEQSVNASRRPQCILNTFVSFDEMRPEQQDIHRRTSELLKRA